MSCSLSACACGAQNTLSFLPLRCVVCFDGIFDLLDEEIAVHGLGCEARDGLFNLPVQVAKSSRWPFPPVCRGKGCFMRRTRGVPEAHFPICLTQKGTYLRSQSSGRPWGITHPAPEHTFLPACHGKVSPKVLAMGISLCLSRKRALFSPTPGYPTGL